MSDRDGQTEEPVKIKKYANRRLYNTATSAYVTLEDLAEMLKQGTDFVVHDAKTSEDITHQVLTQIIFEQENKGENLLPVPFLRQLIRFYGDGMQGLVPGFLEISLDRLAQDQNKLRRQMADTFGASPMGVMEEQVRQNMAMFSDAMKMFTPFVPEEAVNSGEKSPKKTPQPKKTPVKKSAEKPGGNELAALKDQLAAMQAQLNTLSDGKAD